MKYINATRLASKKSYYLPKARTNYQWQSNVRFSGAKLWNSTNINHKGLQRTANEYAEERMIYKDLIRKNEK